MASIIFSNNTYIATTLSFYCCPPSPSPPSPFLLLSLYSIISFAPRVSNLSRIYRQAITVIWGPTFIPYDGRSFLIIFIERGIYNVAGKYSRIEELEGNIQPKGMVMWIAWQGVRKNIKTNTMSFVAVAHAVLVMAI